MEPRLRASTASAQECLCGECSFSWDRLVSLGYIPQGFMIPDPKRHVEIIGREELIDPESWESKPSNRRSCGSCGFRV